MVVLYYMSQDVFKSLLSKSPVSTRNADSLALTASLLHILSPAGIFLSAPYGEALFSFFHFCGLWCYVKACLYRERGDGQSGSLMTLGAGALTGIATTIRSNGVLSGVLFAHDAVEESYHFLVWAKSNGFGNMTEFRRRISRITMTVFAGALLGLGVVGPQVLAWREYCLHVQIGERREWCARSVPSIYAWVQDHYWYVYIGWEVGERTKY